MKKKTKPSLEQRVARYKAIGEEVTSAEEWLGALNEIVEDNDPAAIALLLKLRPYHSADSFIDDMWNVIHAVEGYPADVYAAELLKTAGEMSPYLLETLLVRLMNSDADMPVVIEKLSELPASAKPVVRQLIEKIRDRQRKSNAADAVANCEKVLAAMEGTLSESDIHDIYQRGLKGADGLDAQALFVYALTELQVMAEMEGWDFFFTSEQMKFYAQLKAGLKAAGDRESLEVLEDYEKHLAAHGVAMERRAIDKFLSKQSKKYFRACRDWTGDFMRLADQRWEKIKSHFPAYRGEI